MGRRFKNTTRQTDFNLPSIKCFIRPQESAMEDTKASKDNELVPDMHLTTGFDGLAGTFFTLTDFATAFHTNDNHF